MGYKGNVARNCIRTGAQFKRRETKGKREKERKRGIKGSRGERLNQKKEEGVK
jgi:hypothetical protein